MHLVDVMVHCTVGPKHSSPPSCKRILHPSLLTHKVRCLLARGLLSCLAGIKASHVTCSGRWHVSSDVCEFWEALGSVVCLCQLSFPLQRRRVPDGSRALHVFLHNWGKGKSVLHLAILRMPSFMCFLLKEEIKWDGILKSPLALKFHDYKRTRSTEFLLSYTPNMSIFMHLSSQMLFMV